MNSLHKNYAPLKKSFRRFLLDECGSFAVGFALSILPTLLLSGAAILMTNNLAQSTRLHQSECAAVLAISKEGEQLKDSARLVLAQNWMQHNMLALRRPQKTLEVRTTNNADQSTLFSTYTTIPMHRKSVLKAFNKPQTEEVTAERSYNPIEVVFVLDASLSQGEPSEIALVKKMVKQATNRLFRGKDEDHDVRVSLIAYAGYINIGMEYAEKLVTPKSRKLPAVGSKLLRTLPGEWYPSVTIKSQKTYDRQIRTINRRNPTLRSNLLAHGGPCSRSGVVAVARPPLANGASPEAVAKYVSAIEIPPATPEKGFTLLMADGRQVIENKNIPGTGLAAPIKSYLTSAYYMGLQFWNADILDLGLVPPFDYDDPLETPIIVNSERRDPTLYSAWGGGSRWSNIQDSTVMYFYDAPAMPILIGATNQDEVLNHLKLYSGAWTTAVDEGLAWAWRAIAPEWGTIWEKGENFPALYPCDGGITEKRILFFAGGTTTGYHGERGAPDVITPIGKELKERGVQVHMVAAVNEYLDDDEKQRYGAGTADGKVLEVMKADIPNAMENLATRQYHVRLIENNEPES